MQLKPDKRIHRFLFSSPAHFVGTVETDDYLFVPAFPSLSKGASVFLTEGPTRRSFISITLALEKPETDQPTKVKVREMYSWVADHLAALLSAFYGKLVVNHGYTNFGEIFSVPELDLPGISDYALPAFNGKPRAASGLPDLNVGAASQALKAFFSRGLEDDNWASVLSAAAFYQQALTLFSDRPHLSFSLLVSSLESLLPLVDYSEEELFDPLLLSDFSTIASQAKGGELIVERLKSRMYQVRRKCGAFVAKTLDAQFYERHESSEAFFSVKPDRIDERIKAAYDLRSRFLHTGHSHGSWIDVLKHAGAEVMIGDPVIEDVKETGSAIGHFDRTGTNRAILFISLGFQFVRITRLIDAGRLCLPLR